MAEVFLFAVGIVVGAMNSIAGGGLLIGYPAMLVVGIPPLVANATSHIVVIPGQIGAIYGYRNYLRNISKLYLLLLIPCVIGAAFGALLLTKTPANEFEKLVPALLLTAVAFFAIQPMLHFHFHRHLRSKIKRILPLVIIFLTILPIAVYGGYFGVGLGFVMLAFIGFTKIHDIHRINVLKNIATLCIGITSTIILSKTGLINWGQGLSMAVGCGLGGFFGAHLAQKFSSHVIRIAVIVIGLASITILALNT